MLLELLETPTWICSNNSIVSNEAIPRQLVEIFEALRTSPAYKENPELHQALDKAETVLRPLLSCTCGPSICIKGCACKEGSGNVKDMEGNITDAEQWYRDPGCTLWCSCACKKACHGLANDTSESLAPLNQLRSGQKRGSDTSDLAEQIEKKARN